MDSHNLEPQELNDRIRLYSHKLSQQWGTLQEDTTSVANGTEIYIFSIWIEHVVERKHNFCLKNQIFCNKNSTFSGVKSKISDEKP